jgi:hypothetical protein
MFNLDTLDTVIAIVVVLLVLSLLVQAIQSFIKKVFKLKSKEIEKSLAQLFEHVIDKSATPLPPLNSPPASPSAGGLSSPPAASPASATITAKELSTRVLDEFKSIGRYTRWGSTVLDSISKDDLLKILARIDSKHFYADYVKKFQDMYTDILSLEREINRLVTNDPPLLQGAASARFAEMQQVLTPLINDVKNIAAGNAIKTDVIFGDLINLRQVKLDEALKLLAAAQDSIVVDLKAEREAKNTVTVAALQQLSAGLATIAGILGQLSQRMDAAFTALRARLDHVERWYDTVMQSFEERYTRNMKTVALYVSIAVVVYLNASFFRIYHSIATSDIHRALIVQEGENLVDVNQQKPSNQTARPARTSGASNNTGGATNANSSGGSANRSTAANINTEATALINSNTDGNVNSGNTNNSLAPVTNVTNANIAPGPQPAQTPAANSQDNNLDQLDEQRKVIEDYVDTYEGFGFSPLSWQEVVIWTKGVFGSAARRDENDALINKYGDPIPTNCEPESGQDCKQVSVSADGVSLNEHDAPITADCKPTRPQDCQPVYRPMLPGEWWANRKQDFATLVGWAVMVLLLSVGAPFWQDTLESLFGVKNLLRKRSDTKNVEKESGAGQPRS